MKKTLKQHNFERSALHKTDILAGPVKNGIECPECSAELYDSFPLITLASSPPKKNIHCVCGYVGYRIV